MSVSGIYALIDPRQWEPATRSLRQLPGVDLHQGDASAGRLVLTQEAGSTTSQMAGLERIRQIAGVRMAELAYHYLGDDDGASPDGRPRPE